MTTVIVIRPGERPADAVARLERDPEYHRLSCTPEFQELLERVRAEDDKARADARRWARRAEG